MPVTMTLDDTHSLVRDVLTRAGASETNARHVADNIVAAEAAGVTSHGLNWVPPFADHVASGKVDGRAEPRVTQVAPAGLVVDAGKGFAQAAIPAGLDRLIPLARETGIAAMAVTNSGNCLLVGDYIGRVAAEGLVAFAYVNSPKSMAAWGGARAVLGTNPMAFGCPRRNGPPMVLDLSSSKVARSEIRLAMQQGKKIPLGWALDKNGKPTTDPKAAWEGSVLPFGDYKGYGIALMIDLMAGAMAGALFSHEAAPFLGEDTTPPGTGQFFIAFSPAPFGGPGVLDRVEHLFDAVLSEDGVQLPGDKRHANRARIDIEGIQVADALHEELLKRADRPS